MVRQGAIRTTVRRNDRPPGLQSGDEESGLFLPILAVIGYLAIALYYIIPSRRLSAGFLPRRRKAR